jgi:hypothetical protein
VFFVLIAAGDLGGVSGAEAGSLWKGETGETLEHGAFSGRLISKNDDLCIVSTLFPVSIAHKPEVALSI